MQEKCFGPRAAPPVEFFGANVYVLPPGQVAAVEIEVVELLPVGSDDLFGLVVW